MPNIERMAEHGTLYNNATATAGSTIMTHACEWTGRYPAELHVDVPFEERDYLNFLPNRTQSSTTSFLWASMYMLC